MNEWISKAANVFKREVPETPQPFEVACECGQKHAGLRRVRYQHLICKSCGRSIFVLPRDTYPPPHIAQVPSKKKKKRRKPKPAAKPVPIDFSEPVVIAPQPHQVAPVPEHVDDEEPGPGFFERQIDWLSEFVFESRQAFVNFWSPYRKLAAVIVCLLGVTAFVLYRQSVHAAAVTVSREKYDTGLELIRDQNWIQARQEFEVAASAVDVLGRRDLEANDIRQYARETVAMTRLGEEALFDLVEDAEETYVQHGINAWKSKFKTDYQGNWLIIEGTLRPTKIPSTRSGEPLLELAFPWVVGERMRQVRVFAEFPLATHLPSVGNADNDDVGNVAIFAAQLADCDLSADSEWAVSFDPETAFFWVHEETYVGTHLDIGSIRTEAELTQLLNQQASWMGVR